MIFPTRNLHLFHGFSIAMLNYQMGPYFGEMNIFQSVLEVGDTRTIGFPCYWYNGIICQENFGVQMPQMTCALCWVSRGLLNNLAIALLILTGRSHIASQIYIQGMRWDVWNSWVSESSSRTTMSLLWRLALSVGRFWSCLFMSLRRTLEYTDSDEAHARLDKFEIWHCRWAKLIPESLSLAKLMFFTLSRLWLCQLVNYPMFFFRVRGWPCF
jgi:hypothetical protein